MSAVVGLGELASVLTAKLPCSLFLNPGGPGGLGSTYLSRNADLLTRLSGAQYQLIGWDPRGIGSSGPGPIACYPDAQQAALRQNRTTVEVPPVDRLTETQESSVKAQLQAKYDDGKLECSAHSTPESLRLGQYMASYYNAMDMEFMRRVVDAAMPFHYQGLSYGTVFGACTFATSMTEHDNVDRLPLAHTSLFLPCIIHSKSISPCFPSRLVGSCWTEWWMSTMH